MDNSHNTTNTKDRIRLARKRLRSYVEWQRGKAYKCDYNNYELLAGIALLQEDIEAMLNATAMHIVDDPIKDSSSEELSETLEDIAVMAVDHAPNGWPAINYRTIEKMAVLLRYYSGLAAHYKSMAYGGEHGASN
jgi:hypothetical protein